jgi:hypothetical protein
VLGTEELLIQTLLYLPERPLTIIYLSSITDTPGILFTTSAAFLSCDEKTHKGPGSGHDIEDTPHDTKFSTPCRTTYTEWRN